MKIRTIEIAMLGVIALGCGAGADGLELLNEAVAPVDVEALKAAPVSAEEAEVVEVFLSARTEAKSSIEGRIVRWDDAWMTVDDVLFLAEHAEHADLVEKAYVATEGANPVDFSSIQWWRPDTQRQHTVIIEDTVDQWFFDAFASVVAEYMAMQNNDCIASNTWVVLRRSAFNALPATTKAQTYEINVNYVPITTPGWPCGSVPNGPKACAKLPSIQDVTIFTGGVFVNTSRMALGRTLHFDSGTFKSTDVPKAKRTMRHEVGHNLGLSHQLLPSSILIPGTASCGQCLSEFDSVMKAGGRDSFTADDIVSVKALYMDGPLRANDGCSYVDDFRLTTAFR